MTVKKTTLAEITSELKRLSPEELKKIMDDAAEAAEKAREEQKRKEREPPESKTGTCIVCKGTIKGNYVRGLRPGTDERFVPIGPGSKQYYTWNFKGYSCTKCGLKYEFIPDAVTPEEAV